MLRRNGSRSSVDGSQSSVDGSQSSVDGSQSSVDGSRSSVVGHCSLTTVYRLLITDYRLLITDYRLLITDYRLLITVSCLLSAVACAPRAPITLPTGTGTPYPAFTAAYDQATAACRGVKTIRASMAMSGKAGSTTLRGRIDAGFAAPDQARLEGVHPVFGRPVFVLVAEGGRGTLVLTREDRVLRDAPPEQIVEALAGVPLGPDTLRTAIAGCGFGGSPGDGREYSNGWIAASTGDGDTYLRRGAAGWEVAAPTRGPVTIAYADYAGGRPATIRIRAASSDRTNADLTLRLSDVDINTTLDPRTFQIELPDKPIPLTLNELRKAGPLGGS